MQEWAREMEQQLMSSGKLWAAAADGTVGLGMHQLQFVVGGNFTSALSEAATTKLAEVRRELREVGAEIALTTPSQRNVPLSAQRPIGEASAARLIGGVSADASSPAVMPMLRTMGFSPFQQGAPPKPPVSGGEQVASAAVSIVSLGDLSAAMPLQLGLHRPSEHSGQSEAGVAEFARLTSARMMGMAQLGGTPPMCDVPC